jgi:hypothetical protein
MRYQQRKELRIPSELARYEIGFTAVANFTCELAALSQISYPSQRQLITITAAEESA